MTDCYINSRRRRFRVLADNDVVLNYEIAPVETDSEEDVSDGEWTELNDNLEAAGDTSADVITDGVVVDGVTITGTVDITPYAPVQGADVITSEEEEEEEEDVIAPDSDSSST